jgi:uncharacterized protein
VALPKIVEADIPTSKGRSMPKQIVWVDIPVVDLDRAVAFYSAVLGSAVTKEEHPGMSIGLLSHGHVSGCLHHSDSDRPSDQGPLLYLNCSGRLDNAVAAVVPNGGKVLQSKHAIGSHGFRGMALDSEGNRIALHFA